MSDHGIIAHWKKMLIRQDRRDAAKLARDHDRASDIYKPLTEPLMREYHPDKVIKGDKPGAERFVDQFQMQSNGEHKMLIIARNEVVETLGDLLCDSAPICIGCPYLQADCAVKSDLMRDGKTVTVSARCSFWAKTGKCERDPFREHKIRGMSGDLLIVDDPATPKVEPVPMTWDASWGEQWATVDVGRLGPKKSIHDKDTPMSRHAYDEELGSW